MKPLFDGKVKIKKKPEKGGWCYVVIGKISGKEKSAMGLVRIRGFVDNYELKQFNLLPMKNGSMLLPLKASLRKAICKKEGNFVHVTLYRDQSSTVIPEEIIDSLSDSPKALDFFMSLSDSNKKYYIDWVFEAKKVDTKIARILKMIQQLENRKKFWDWPAPQ